MQKVLDKYPDKFKKGVTHTSRKMRPGEKEGFNYYYVTEDQFIKLKDQNGLVELNFYNGNYYGLSKKEFDTNGAKTVHDLGIPTNFLAILPPSEETLEKRLKGRETESEEVIKGRLETAKKETKEIGSSISLIVKFIMILWSNIKYMEENLKKLYPEKFK